MTLPPQRKKVLLGSKKDLFAVEIGRAKRSCVEFGSLKMKFTLRAASGFLRSQAAY
jgi:hypothetical protein